MFEWVDNLLYNESSAIHYISDALTRYQEWFVAIKAYFANHGSYPDAWATSNAYVTAMEQYGDIIWKFALLGLAGFIICALMLYKLCSSFVGWYRMR